MEQKTPRQKSHGKDQKRADRLKAALKANMAKRKAQTKGRTGADLSREMGRDTVSDKDKG